MRISELSGRTGVSPTTLRFYEDIGLLHPGRTSAGYRTYGDDTVDRLTFIAAAKKLGLSLDDIGELLPIWQDDTCGRVKADLRLRIRNQLDRVQARRAELVAFAASLEYALGRLDELPDRTDRCDPTCAFLGATPASEGAPRVRPAPRPAGPEVPMLAVAPAACSLSAGDMRERIERWHTVLHGATRTAIEGGVELMLPVDRAGAVADLAVAEQQCCPFYDFRLSLQNSSLLLQVRVPARARDSLDQLFGTAEQRQTFI